MGFGRFAAVGPPFSTPLDDTQTHQCQGWQLVASCGPGEGPPGTRPARASFFIYIFLFFWERHKWPGLTASCKLWPRRSAPGTRLFLFIYIYLFFWERHKWPGLTASCRLWPREGPPGTRLFFIIFFLQSL
jgi:hypothetical protein